MSIVAKFKRRANPQTCVSDESEKDDGVRQAACSSFHLLTRSLLTTATSFIEWYPENVVSFLRGKKGNRKVDATADSVNQRSLVPIPHQQKPPIWSTAEGGPHSMRTARLWNSMLWTALQGHGSIIIRCDRGPARLRGGRARWLSCPLRQLRGCRGSRGERRPVMEAERGPRRGGG